jgi:hypothetical protein
LSKKYNRHTSNEKHWIKCLWTEKNGPTAAAVKIFIQNAECYLSIGQKEWTKCP